MLKPPAGPLGPLWCVHDAHGRKCSACGYGGGDIHRSKPCCLGQGLGEIHDPSSAHPNHLVAAGCQAFPRVFLCRLKAAGTAVNLHHIIQARCLKSQKQLLLNRIKGPGSRYHKRLFPKPAYLLSALLQDIPVLAVTACPEFYGAVQHNLLHDICIPSFF